MRLECRCCEGHILNQGGEVLVIVHFIAFGEDMADGGVDEIAPFGGEDVGGGLIGRGGERGEGRVD